MFVMLRNNKEASVNEAVTKETALGDEVRQVMGLDPSHALQTIVKALAFTLEDKGRRH